VIAGSDPPIAGGIEGVRALAGSAPTLDRLSELISVCRACPRLVAWRESVARDKRRAYAHETYWGRPVPGWGDDRPRILVVGLAPAAHGGNRTGRIFTGDRSGDWLFAALYRAGLATHPTSTHRGDGQQLVGTRMLAAVRCAPPANKPTVEERDTCAPWFRREIEYVWPWVRSVIALGAFAWQAVWELLGERRPAFGHGVTGLVDDRLVIASYHPSQQNTFTGKLTAAMLDDVIDRAVSYAAEEHRADHG
jgi:uracil-DNA glycosylase